MTKRILIIDDDKRNIFALTATLRSLGYECVSAEGAQQGIDYIDNQGNVGIVLLDMMMPDMDGYEAIPRIKSRHEALPIIAVTAQAMAGDREKCLQAGADDYISKPIDVDRLVTILSRYVA